MRDGDRVAAGAPLTDGPWDPAELLAAVGAARTARFLIDEVQAVYRAQGVAIHDTHVEVIVRQMLRGVRVTEAGDTDLLPGEVVDRAAFAAAVERALAQGGAPAVGEVALLGVTRAGELGGGFLAAAAAREPARALARGGAGAGDRRAARPHRQRPARPAAPGRRRVGRRAGRFGVAAGPGRCRAARGRRRPARGRRRRPRDAGEAEIDARSLATLLAGLHAPLEPAPAG